MKTTITNERITGNYHYWTEVIETPVTNYFLTCGKEICCTVFNSEKEAQDNIDYFANLWHWNKKNVKIIAKNDTRIEIKNHKKKVRG